MCLMVYLGTDAPVPGFSDADVSVGDAGLASPVSVRPAALANKAHVAQVADRLATGWNCSCVFLDSGFPPDMLDQVDPDDLSARARAYEGLRRIVQGALAMEARPVLFSCWSGEEGDPVRITRQLVPADLQAEAGLFDDLIDGGEGRNPPILIHLETAS